MSKQEDLVKDLGHISVCLLLENAQLMQQVAEVTQALCGVVDEEFENEVTGIRLNGIIMTNIFQKQSDLIEDLYTKQMKKFKPCTDDKDKSCTDKDKSS